MSSDHGSSSEIVGGPIRVRSSFERTGDPPASTIWEPPATSPPRAVPLPDTTVLDDRLIAILDAPLADRETIAVGYRNKEQALAAFFATLTILESRALHARLSDAKAGDVLVARFCRMTADRRGRLLDFLADARRREAIASARR